MSYKAEVYNVMIASPSDVLKERGITREIVNSWNFINSDKTKIVLLPTGWETHSSPLMGERAQDLIHKQVTDKADLLIGIFWTRIGTKTGDFESGTIEEIERHIKKNKPAMLYFSEAPVRMDSVESIQYKKLMKFKKECFDKGLVETYSTIEEFQARLKDHLMMTINDHVYFKSLEVPINQNEDLIRVETNPFKLLELELSSEAKDLLVGCAKEESNITLLKLVGSSFIIHADKEYTAEGQRECAKWEAMLDQLNYNELIKENYFQSGKSYDLTNKGYEFVDYLSVK
ncbi:hypothetical protein [Saccharicrinis aurantiacus]|uniref:hypothetical protein n=1 Tax=Saccharicrinis aurantiacus TaxID=1849719 RepID=UPI000837FE4F|nr:hypothetical protein [Saccharicrinis aurantiacus]